MIIYNFKNVNDAAKAFRRMAAAEMDGTEGLSERSVTLRVRRVKRYAYEECARILEQSNLVEKESN